ncbi:MULTISPECIES: PA3496 family putative envelope integrity protein [Larsenimonas]|uniref:Uncharacterized protein n=1 Tax=Larsenimonas suaedae TaxID=1851019 RepID=A0ABU1GVP0_9GAMM|nr:MULTISPECIES: hypothetical protein [Larsenimonas]MCM2973186.1 hypothetical protein [Larsenimonas suaedae]MCM5705641.1 hypothetical protein [Larsenimonas salina]MDR5896079.1 hypothetical protein [Larsenimonas suaedae]
MHKGEQLATIKAELLDIYMALEAEQHEKRKQTAEMRYVKARKGIEQHREERRLERDLKDINEEAARRKRRLS